MKIKLTQTALYRIPAPATGRTTVYDTEATGLAVQITQNNARTFYVVKWRDGKVHWVRLGTVDEMTIDQARRAAADVRDDIRDGVDPNAVKRQARAAATLADMWETYRKAVVKRERTMVEDLGLWTRYLDPWASKRISDITEEATQRIYNRIADGKLDRKAKDSRGRMRPINGGKTAAVRTIMLLSGMFSECGKTFGLAGFNPARGVRKDKLNAKERYLTAEELPALWRAMEGQTDGMQDLVKLALFTAQRRTTLMEMRWDEISLAFNTWTIPAAKMKGGKAHIVPLVTQAVAILQRRRKAAAEDAEWVFPASSETGHMQEPKKAINAIVKASGLPHFSLHDLRRTCATWMNSTGASLSTIQAVLAQRPQSVAGIHYIKSTADSMRQSLQTAADAMETAAGVVTMTPAAVSA